MKRYRVRAGCGMVLAALWASAALADLQLKSPQEIKGALLENAHKIVDTNKLANVDVEIPLNSFVAKGNNTTRKTIAVMIEQPVNGKERGYELSKSEMEVKRIGTIGGAASVAEGEPALRASFATRRIQARTVLTAATCEVTLTASERYVLDARAMHTNALTTVNVLGAIVSTQRVGFSPATLPAKGAKLGDTEKLTYTSDGTLSEMIAEIVAADPPKLSITPVKYVLFDDREAVLVESVGSAYEVTTVNAPSLPAPLELLSKVDVTFRGYIDTATGRPLWSETQSEIIDSDWPTLIGSKTVFRELQVN